VTTCNHEEREEIEGHEEHEEFFNSEIAGIAGVALGTALTPPRFRVSAAKTGECGS